MRIGRLQTVSVSDGLVFSYVAELMTNVQWYSGAVFEWLRYSVNRNRRGNATKKVTPDRPLFL
jgi:hypothetical protein